MTRALYRCIWIVVFTSYMTGAPAPSHAANALERYIQQPDHTFAWHVDTQTTIEGVMVTYVKMTSQTWRGHPWSHHLQIIRPHHLRHPEMALLLITGDHSTAGSAAMLQALADRAGSVVAEVTRVPNQPLFEGRKEDALLAYTFDQFLRTGDDTWPALLPMTKSAVRAMDTLQAWAQQKHVQTIEKFVVTGASKRGWTTWLTGAVDPRVAAIAPMVIDVLNMPAQTEWAEKVYGNPSDKLSDYTELNLAQHMNSPSMQRLRSWIDPYSYRARYTMPKLLLLGTNDPYWTVDSLRHYWDDLPEPKLVFQTPNAGHRLGQEATETLAAFFEMMTEKEPLPKMDWRMAADGHGLMRVTVDRPAKAMHLWTADSATRDFRRAKWSRQTLDIAPGSSMASAEIDPPASGYRAFMGEVVLSTSSGHEYKLSTQVQVLPDDVK
jgi:PhoPQ-activated pathogenicity-related protein